MADARVPSLSSAAREAMAPWNPATADAYAPAHWHERIRKRAAWRRRRRRGHHGSSGRHYGNNTCRNRIAWRKPAAA